MKGPYMNLQLACQTITWGDGQPDRFEEIFTTVKAAGFDGVEIGFRHLRNTPPESLTELLAKHGLVLAASHVGGNLDDRAQAGGERTILDEALDYLSATGCRRLMYSGLNVASVEAALDDIAVLGRGAETAAARGIQLLYHNHHWEFLRPGIMDALLARAPATLGLCPDVGWLYRAGVDVMAFLERNAARIGALHFKDFASPGDGEVSFNMDTVPLGQGLAPLRAVADWLRTSPVATDPFWVIAEQDRHGGPAAEAAALNGQFLNNAFKGG